MKNKNNNNVKMWQLFHPEWFQAITGSTRACLEIKGYSTCSPAPPLQSRFPGSYPLEGHFHPILRFLPQRQGPPYPGGVGGNPSLGGSSHLQHPPRTPAPAPAPPGGEEGRGHGSSAHPPCKWLSCCSRRTKAGAAQWAPRRVPSL